MRFSKFPWTLATLFTVGTVLLIAVPFAGAHGSDDLTIDVQYDSLERTVLVIGIDDFGQEIVQVRGKDYLEIGLEGEGLVMKEGAGYPNLPAIYRSVMIPDTAHMQVNVLDMEFYEITEVDLLSNRGNILRTVDPATVPFTFGEDYRKNAWFPQEITTLREPYILHDVRGITVEVFPFQYNPVQRVLRVYTDLTVEIVADGTDTVNIPDRAVMKKRPDRSFYGIYQNFFLNSGGGDRTDPPTEDGDLLIISHGPFMAAMQPLVTWKNSLNIATTIVDVATIGNNSAAIKNHITNVYNSSNLSFVLLVGDSYEVASGYYGAGLSDAYYSTITADKYPDLFVGRFSATATAHVDTQVERTIAYEQAGHALGMGGWNTWGMGIASSEGAGAGHYGESDKQHIDLIRAELLTYGFAKVDQIYDPSASKSAVAAGLNEGRRAVNYCGHGSSTSWGTTGFSSTDVNNLINEGMLPFICSVACVNGSFGSGTCFAEAWLRATYNGEPTGAIACYMSSVNQSWAPPMYAQGNHQKSGKYGAAERFWMETNWSVGGVWYGGSCCMMDLAGSTGQQEFMNWVIFGDPSLRLFSEPALTMKFPDGLPDGYQPPGLATEIMLEIFNGLENYVPGSGLLHYRFDRNDPFSTVAVTPLGGNLYSVTLPNTAPGDEPEFYFSAKGDKGATLLSPPTAPADYYAFDVYFAEIVMEDNFEVNSGWTVANDSSLTTGAWERAVPQATDAQPGQDHSVDGTQCYVTGPLAGSSIGSYDVDGGPTILTSPVIDLSDGDAQITYYRWHYNDDGDDYFTVEVSNDNGATWKVAEKIMGGSGGWSFHAFNVADFVTPTANVKVRFSASDFPNNSITEGLLDDLMVQRLIYDATFWADAYHLSVAAGGTVNFSMNAGAPYASRSYLILGSLSGTSPGFTLPGGTKMPLNWDALTNFILASLGSPVFQNFMGSLDGSGTAQAAFDTLGPVNPVLVGQTINFAYLLSPPPGWDFASNPIPLTFEP